MTYEEYLEQRNGLLASAQEALNENRLEDAEQITASIEKLDTKYQAIIEATANLQAMDNNLPPVPEVIQDNENENMNLEEEEMSQTIYNASSVEYKNAWLKEMARNAKGKYLCGEPTPEEMNAFTFTTANTGEVVPTEVLNRIAELVPSMAPMYEDSTPSEMTSGFSLPRHKSIEAGDATNTNEGVANSDEEDDFDTLDLSGVEIKKHINITRKMSFQSIEAFEDWIVSHLAARIAVAKEARILSQLDNTTYGIAAANKLTNKQYTDANIRLAFSQIKDNGEVRVYANRKTIWTGLFDILDGQNRQLFIPNSMDDPAVQGRIYGAIVKVDENISDNVAYIGIPKKILANDFDKLTTAREMDAKTFVTTIGAYSLFDAGLENPLAFVKVSFS